MILFLKFFIGLIIHQLTNFLCNKKNYLLDNPNFSIHKELTKNKNLPLTGGITFLILFLIFVDGFIELKIFGSLIFFIGLFSDLNFINSPKLRFFAQIIITLLFVSFFQNNVFFTDINIIDKFLENYYFSIFFTAFCLLILINGTNFIDGLNGLVITYYIIVLSILTLASNLFNLYIDLDLVVNLVLILLILLIFNVTNKNFIGDSGSYLISFIIGSFLISFYNQNQNVSSLFIVLLLWYPAFEIFFSIIRKLIKKKNPFLPDRSHLHQKIFLKILNKNEKEFKSNLFTSFLINFYNIIIFLISLYFINNSNLISLVLTINISIYLISFYKT